MVDANPSLDSSVDAVSECGPPPPPGAPCLQFIDDRAGQFCCSDVPTPLECRDGSWQCPLGFFEASECTISASTCPWFECDAMDAYSSPVGVDCAGIDITRYTWDGRACRPVGFGCAHTPCVGEDCDSLYDTLEQCLEVRIGCGAGQCEAMDAWFPPAGSLLTCDGGDGDDWWTWNGWACEQHSDCAGSPEHCVGADCESAYPDRETCETARRGCIDSCDATDASVTCDGFGGTSYYVWNGHDCALVERCPEAISCSGSECDEVYTSQEECRNKYRDCVGPATVNDRRALTCNVSEAELVEAAVRLDACGVTRASHVISGWFELHTALPVNSFDPGWIADCNLVECARTTTDCASLEACRASRDEECGDGTMCVGHEVCRRDVRDGEAFNAPWADCTTLGGSCVPSDFATCEVPGNPTEGRSNENWCDRDNLVFSINGSAVRLACSEFLPGTVCREILFAGEFPGVACGYPDPECSEFLTTRVSCDGDEALLCVGGRTQRFDCVEAGYSGCEDILGCVL